MAKSGTTRGRRRRRPGPPVVTYIEGEKLIKNKATGFAYFHLPDENGTKKRFYQGRFCVGKCAHREVDSGACWLGS